MEYGYVRVSTREQNEQRQVIALNAYGLSGKQIYMDKQSGKDFERTNYKRMIRKKSRDTLVIKSIDRLGRNYDEILEQWLFFTCAERLRNLMPEVEPGEIMKTLAGMVRVDPPVHYYMEQLG